MRYRVEAWTIDSPEEPCEEQMEEAVVFDNPVEAMRWAWVQMEAGYATRMWRE